MSENKVYDLNGSGFFLDTLNGLMNVLVNNKDNNEELVDKDLWASDVTDYLIPKLEVLKEDGYTHYKFESNTKYMGPEHVEVFVNYEERSIDELITEINEVAELEEVHTAFYMSIINHFNAYFVFY